MSDDAEEMYARRCERDTALRDRLVELLRKCLRDWVVR